MPMSTFAHAAERVGFEKPVSDWAADGLAQDKVVAQTDAPFAPGEIVVGFHADRVQAASAMQNLPMQFAADVVDCPVAVPAESVNAAGADEGKNAAIIAQRFLTPVGQELDIINQLRADPAVAYAGPNWIVQAADWPAYAAQKDAPQQTGVPVGQNLVEAAIETPFAVNDKYYDQQWYMQRINASRAWALAEAAGITASALAPVRVAIVDSGIDASHPELQGRIAESQNYVTPGAAADDDYGHGTHVAGLIGATLNNHIGIAGPARNVTYDVRKVLDNAGKGFITDVAQGVKDAADAGAQIINLSLQIDSNDPTLFNCIKYAYNQGALLIAAAGNFSSLRVQWPAAYDEVMAVAATSYEDTPASYNSSGCQLSANPLTRCGVEIAAPGGTGSYYLTSTWPPDVNCNAPVADNPIPKDYCRRQGTSMAAAVASGVAALIWGIDPALTAEELRALLKQTAAPIPGKKEVTGAGRLDALAAVRLALPGDFQVTTDHVDAPLQPGAAPFTTTMRMDNSSLPRPNGRPRSRPRRG
ncbi:MAG: S8 family serine peptidase [Caldilineaceae bacterium]